MGGKEKGGRDTQKNEKGMGKKEIKRGNKKSSSEHIYFVMIFMVQNKSKQRLNVVYLLSLPHPETFHTNLSFKPICIFTTRV